RWRQPHLEGADVGFSMARVSSPSDPSPRLRASPSGSMNDPKEAPTPRAEIGDERWMSKRDSEGYQRSVRILHARLLSFGWGRRSLSVRRVARRSPQGHPRDHCGIKSGGASVATEELEHEHLIIWKVIGAMAAPIEKTR